MKDEPAAEIRAAITEVAAGRDWISPRLAYILATDDAPDRPALSEQERRALQLYATGMPMKSGPRRMAISGETVNSMLNGSVRNTRERDGPHQQSSGCIIEPSRTGTSHRLPDGRYSPPMRPPGNQDVPVLGFLRYLDNLHFQYHRVMTPIEGS